MGLVLTLKTWALYSVRCPGRRPLCLLCFPQDEPLEYFEKTGHTLLRYSDEVTEAVHNQLRMFEERHKLKRNNKSSQGHADAQHTCVVFYNSVALGDISINLDT